MLLGGSGEPFCATGVPKLERGNQDEALEPLNPRILEP